MTFFSPPVIYFVAFPRLSTEMSDDNTLDVVDVVEEGVVESSTRAAWEGSDVTRAEIDWLIRTRRIRAGVECRPPGPEITPDPKEEEYVIFVAHFEQIGRAHV